MSSKPDTIVTYNGDHDLKGKSEKVNKEIKKAKYSDLFSLDDLKKYKLEELKEIFKKRFKREK